MWLELGGHIRVGVGGSGAYEGWDPLLAAIFFYTESRGQSRPQCGPTSARFTRSHAIAIMQNEKYHSHVY